MEVLVQCKDKIREADIVLVGFGREFNIKREDILKSEKRYLDLDLDNACLSDLEKEYYMRM